MAHAAEMLNAAHEAVRARNWVAARSAFAAAREHQPLSADDLKAFANCQWWLGDLDGAVAEQQQVYQLYLAAGDTGAAALVALDIGYTMSFRGEEAQGSGWLRRAARLLDDHPDGVERGYLDYVLGFETAFNALDLATAEACAERTHALGKQFDDPALIALGVMGQGRVLVRRGDVAAGLALLDEAMLTAVSDDLDPSWAGNIYCHPHGDLLRGIGSSPCHGMDRGDGAVVRGHARRRAVPGYLPGSPGAGATGSRQLGGGRERSPAGVQRRRPPEPARCG